MCAKAGVSTNHSLQTYGATTLFWSGVSEKLVQQRTGHRSVEVLQQYKGTSESQLVEISNIISGENSTGKPLLPAEQPILSVKQLIPPSEQPVVVSSMLSEEHPQHSIQIASTIVLKGCNFTGCLIAFSDNQSIYI